MAELRGEGSHPTMLTLLYRVRQRGYLALPKPLGVLGVEGLEITPCLHLPFPPHHALRLRWEQLLSLERERRTGHFQLMAGLVMQRRKRTPGRVDELRLALDFLQQTPRIVARSILSRESGASPSCGWSAHTLIAIASRHFHIWLRICEYANNTPQFCTLTASHSCDMLVRCGITVVGEELEQCHRNREIHRAWLH